MNRIALLNINSHLKNILKYLFGLFSILILTGGCVFFHSGINSFKHDFVVPNQDKLDYQIKYDIDVVKSKPGSFYWLMLICEKMESNNMSPDLRDFAPSQGDKHPVWVSINIRDENHQLVYQSSQFKMNRFSHNPDSVKFRLGDGFHDLKPGKYHVDVHFMSNDKNPFVGYKTTLWITNKNLAK